MNELKPTWHFGEPKKKHKFLIGHEITCGCWCNSLQLVQNSSFAEAKAKFPMMWRRKQSLPEWLILEVGQSG